MGPLGVHQHKPAVLIFYQRRTRPVLTYLIASANKKLKRLFVKTSEVLEFDDINSTFPGFDFGHK
jgi:hypothetical protein